MDGLTAWENESPAVTVIRLHYAADPAKNPNTPEGRIWAEEAKRRAPSEAWWRQEQEIDFMAQQGARVYHQFQDDDRQVVKRFPIPENWTRIMGLDPHPRVPHALLWCAMSPEGILYAYREMWPSRAYGTNKNVPEDDNIYSIKHYCGAIKWLESAENPENGGKAEKIFKRVIDYAARGFGVDKDNPDAINYQERYENYSRDIGHPLNFEDCVKDNEAAYAEVNEWLRPVPTMGPDGEVIQRSKFRVFEDLSELRWELLNNRHRILQAHQVDVKDPEFKILEKRNHVVDCAKYIIQSKPQFIQRRKRRHTASYLAVT